MLAVTKSRTHRSDELIRRLKREKGMYLENLCKIEGAAFEKAMHPEFEECVMTVLLRLQWLKSGEKAEK